MTQDKKALGQESGKPDWFQLVDSDAPSAQVAKVNKKLPAIALIVTGVIAVSGTFFANASNENQIIGSTVSSTTAAAVSDVVDANTNATPQTSANTSKSSKSSKVVSVTSTVAPTGAVQNPSQGGVAAPSAGREDDDEDDGHWGWLPGRDHDDDEEDDDDHEEREGHEREERH